MELQLSTMGKVQFRHLPIDLHRNIKYKLQVIGFGQLGQIGNKFEQNCSPPNPPIPLISHSACAPFRGDFSNSTLTPARKANSNNIAAHGAFNPITLSANGQLNKREDLYNGLLKTFIAFRIKNVPTALSFYLESIPSRPTDEVRLKV